MTPKQESEMAGAVLAFRVERHRQVCVEGYDPEHDDTHTQGEIAMAAVCYAMPPDSRELLMSMVHPKGALWWWPWSASSYKPSAGTKEGRLREIAKAGALLLAEYERISRT